MIEEVKEEKDLSNVFQGLFQQTSGEEDMLRVASKYALQLNPKQIKLLLFIRWLASYSEKDGERLEKFVDKYLEMKQYCNSAIFVMKLFEFMSMKKWIGQGLDIKVQK